MEKDFELDMSEYLPLRDVVFNTLRKAILKGDLVPGQRLMEISLAQKLGVSRTPVREAIRKLELEGLVVMIPRKGAEVAQISGKQLRDVLEVRRALEELAGELACHRMKEEEIKLLETENRRFAKTLKSNDITVIAEADERFHGLIYQATDNDRLIQMVNHLREQMYRYRIEHIKNKEIRSLLVEEHEEIIRALRSRQVQEVRAAIHRHIEKQEISVARNLKEQGEGKNEK